MTAFLPPSGLLPVPSPVSERHPTNKLCRKRQRPHHPPYMLRHHLLGNDAAAREKLLVRESPHAWQRITISRAIVIFADYLADLVVLDVASDVISDPTPALALLAVATGLVGSVLAADLISALAAWLHWNYAPQGYFEILPLVDPSISDRHAVVPATLKAGSRRRARWAPMEFSNVRGSGRTGVLTSALDVVLQHEVSVYTRRRKDVFEKLVNSCAICTAPLSVLAGWTVGVEGAPAVLFETFFIGTLSLCALVPVLRSDGSENGVVGALRSRGILKARGAPGWCAICGVWDTALDKSQLLTVLQFGLSHVIHVNPQSIGRMPPWVTEEAHDDNNSFPPTP